MFTFITALAFLHVSLAAPSVHLAPIRRAVDVGGQSGNGGHIISIKPDTVNPSNRDGWLNKILSAANVTLDEETTQSLTLDWSKDVFNGFAGKFSPEALTALQKQPEVAWIQEGPSLNKRLFVQMTIIS